MTKGKCKYQEQDAAMTLREGIQEYYSANPHLLQPSNPDPPSLDFFENHDRIHFVFGCDTSISSEFRADFWTIFGTDVGFLKYLSFIKSPAILALMKDVQKRAKTGEMKVEIRSAVISGIKTVPQVFLRTRKMKKKWPWAKSQMFLDQPLGDLRREYGIEVLS